MMTNNTFPFSESYHYTICTPLESTLIPSHDKHS
jgi:hypothetical protein